MQQYFDTFISIVTVDTKPSKFIQHLETKTSNTSKRSYSSF